MNAVNSSLSFTEAAPEAPAPTFRALVRGDIEAWTKIWRGPSGEDTVSLRHGLKLVWTQCGLRATLLFRLSHALWRSHIPMLPGMVARLNLTLHGLDIPPSVEIGPGLYIPHPVGTVVMAQRVGANVSLVSAITIGMRATPDFPVIGDGVFVGAGARILGAIIVGAGANIGANAVVLKDVPPGATAVGVPARILASKETIKDEDAF
jgi:serine O-acetyltransferase